MQDKKLRKDFETLVHSLFELGIVSINDYSAYKYQEFVTRVEVEEKYKNGFEHLNTRLTAIMELLEIEEYDDTDMCKGMKKDQKKVAFKKEKE